MIAPCLRLFLFDGYKLLVHVIEAERVKKKVGLELIFPYLFYNRRE